MDNALRYNLSSISVACFHAVLHTQQQAQRSDGKSGSEYSHSNNFVMLMQLIAKRSYSVSIKRVAAAALLTMASAAAFADDIADVQKLMSAGKATEALQRADQFLTNKPRDPMMRFLRGLSLSQLGRTAEAITTFTKLTEDYPELPEPFNNLAVLYAQQGQYDKARTALEMAIRTNPSYATAYENLGDVYAKLASQAYSKALQIDTRSAVAPKLAMIRDIFPKDRNSAVAAATSNTATPAAAPQPTPAAPPVVAAATPAAPATPPKAAAPAASKPVAVATASAAKPEAKPEPKPEPTSSGSGAERDVESALQAWAAAWSHKDLDSYFAAYSKDFNGGKTRHAWEEDRRARINGKRSISVKVSDIKVQINGDRAVVRFRQAYKADSLDISSHKVLEMTRSTGGWVITKESTGS